MAIISNLFGSVETFIVNVIDKAGLVSLTRLVSHWLTLFPLPYNFRSRYTQLVLSWSISINRWGLCLERYLP